MSFATLPADRVVTETDFPATRSCDRSIDRPGAVASIESRLAALWSVETAVVRERGWDVVPAVDALSGRLARATGSTASRRGG